MYWCAGIEAVIALLVVWFMPKRMTRQEIYNTWMAMGALAAVSNTTLALTFKFYDMATPNPDWQVIIGDALFPTAVGVIWLNFMPSRRRDFTFYLIFVLFVSDCIELVNVHFGYITYRHWNIWLSTLVYLLGMLYLRWHLHFLRSKKM